MDPGAVGLPVAGGRGPGGAAELGCGAAGSASARTDTGELGGDLFSPYRASLTLNQEEDVMFK